MTRCNNCGWENNSTKKVCEKCKNKLGNSNNNSSSKQPPAFKTTMKGESISTPFLDQSFNQNQNNNDMNICPNCHASNRAGTNNCVYCQFPLNNTEPKKEEIIEPEILADPPFTGTIGAFDPVFSNAFTIQRLDKTGQETGEPFEFSGESIQLNRKNLEESNRTITSKIQAEIMSNKDGKWFIENKSEKESSYVRLEKGQPIEIKDGQVIMFGNRRFVFKTI